MMSEIIVEFEIDERLTEALDNIFFDIKPNKVYYLITETSIFAIKNKEYELMKYLVEKWNCTNGDTICFDRKGMSNKDIMSTTKTINLLNDIYDKRSNK